MKKFQLHTHSRKLLGDTLTPVGIYLRIRDLYPNSVLLESSDYHGDEHSVSYVCCDSISDFIVNDEEISISYPDGSSENTPISSGKQVIQALEDFSKSFTSTSKEDKFITDGIFGYTSYNSVRYFEDLQIQDFEDDSRKVPDMIYKVFSIIIVFNHFNDTIHIYEHSKTPNENRLDEIEKQIRTKDFATYTFKTKGEETSNLTDTEFLEIAQKGKDHCQRGDVFQIVLSRRFEQEFEGDDFNAYRALRAVNPSPYLFYFDFGNFKLFGSSPEAQLIIKDKKATIHPIAGTFRRTGNDEHDYELAKKLFDDPKENSEHVMLVDLARNDLSINGSNVEVKTFKEIQFYSHVIHLVSKVTGEMHKDAKSVQLVADTFPAGTLSGAPKPMALKLINKYENATRGYYGGAIGHLGFNGNFNHCIMIRTFLSKNNTLFYQAGAGVVAKSVIESELQEVNNKLMALKTAIGKANDIL